MITAGYVILEPNTDHIDYGVVMEALTDNSALPHITASMFAFISMSVSARHVSLPISGTADGSQSARAAVFRADHDSDSGSESGPDTDSDSDFAATSGCLLMSPGRTSDDTSVLFALVRFRYPAVKKHQAR